jgi:hypothetical protein
MGSTGSAEPYKAEHPTKWGRAEREPEEVIVAIEGVDNRTR